MNTLLGISGIKIEEIKYAEDVNEFLKKYDGNIINIFPISYVDFDGYAVVYKTTKEE